MKISIPTGNGWTLILWNAKIVVSTEPPDFGQSIQVWP